MRSITLSLLFYLCPFVLTLSAMGVPTSTSTNQGEIVVESALQRRTDPVFPDQPPSCPICAKDYPSMSSCAEAAPVLQNFTNIIFNPGAFISVIKCACIDTFQSVFPQCVDCFLKTGQQDILNTPNLPAVVDGMRKICAVESTLLGNVSNIDGETTPSAQAASPTNNVNSGVVRWGRIHGSEGQNIFVVVAVTLMAGLGSLFF